MSNGSEGFGDFDGFEENGVPDMRHIKHNHTYTVPPGEAPKERKSDIKKVRFQSCFPCFGVFCPLNKR